MISEKNSTSKTKLNNIINLDFFKFNANRQFIDESIR